MTYPDAVEEFTFLTPGHPVYRPKKFEYARIWMRKTAAAAAAAAKAAGETTLRAPQKNSNYDPGEYTGSPGQRKFRSKYKTRRGIKNMKKTK